MSDELAHLEKDLLGQLRKMQDYLDALEAQNSELILQNNSLEAQNTTLHTAQNNLIERQLELTTQNDALKRQNQALLGQLNDAKTYQSDLMTQNKELIAQHKQIISSHNELTTQNKQLRESLKLSESQILKLTKQLSEVQDQPLAPSMTTTNEPFMSEKDELIEKLQTQLALETKRNSEMRAIIMLLERR